MDYQIGMVIKGKVSGIQPYGAFVSIDDTFHGLIHISEISDGYVKEVETFVALGQIVDVKIIDIDKETKQLKLSIKALNKVHKRREKRVAYRYKKRGIVETAKGFSALQMQLPKWIEQSIEKMREHHD